MVMSHCHSTTVFFRINPLILLSRKWASSRSSPQFWMSQALVIRSAERMASGEESGSGRGLRFNLLPES
eukprot:4651380-Heterocapsa_arctica.AAC.1